MVQAAPKIKVDSNLDDDLNRMIGLTTEADELRRKEIIEKNKKIEPDRIARLILQIDARAISLDANLQEQIFEESRKKLAASLGCTPEDLQSIVDSYGEAQWQTWVLEERVAHGISSPDMRDISWDRLESATLRKLLFLVDANKVNAVSELLSIASAANKANRGQQRAVTPHAPGGFNVNQTNVYLPGNPSDGVLPGGNLGKIHLNLGPRVIKQIEGSRNRPDMTDAPQLEMRKLDSIEMLNLKEVQDAIIKVENPDK